MFLLIETKLHQFSKFVFIVKTKTIQRKHALKICLFFFSVIPAKEILKKRTLLAAGFMYNDNGSKSAIAERF